jgi:zinc protease
MKRALIAVMILGLLFGLSVTFASAQDDQAQKIAEGKKYMEKSIEALGGRDRLLKVGDRTMIAELKLLTMGLSITRTAYMKGSSKIRLDNKVMGTNSNMAYNGKAGWISQAGSIIDMPQQILDELKRGVESGQVLLFPDKYDVIVTFEGRKSILAKDYIVIKQSYKDGHVNAIYLDPQTYLPYKTIAPSLNETMQKVETETITSDYRDVEGIKVPFSMKIVQGGVDYAAITITEYKFHQQLEDSLFEKPAN